MFPYIAFVADGLTLGEIMQDIPHDGPAFVVYTLLLVSGLVIWKGSRR